MRISRLSATPESRWSTLWPILLLALVAGSAFINSLPGIFIWDDYPIILGNPLFKPLRIDRILVTDYWGHGAGSGLYRPLTIFSYGLNLILGGPSPLSFHVMNMLLHVAVSLLGYLLFLRMGFERRTSWFSSALFAVHPIHAEVLNMVTGRAELLAALFMTLGFLAALGPSRRQLPLTSLWYILALLSKEHAAVFLPLLILADLFLARDRRPIWRERASLYTILSLVTGAWLALRWWVLRPGYHPPNVIYPTDNPLPALSLAARLASVAKVQFLYLAKLFFPWRLAAVYTDRTMGVPVTPLSFQGIGLVFLFVILAAALVAGWHRRAPWSFGLAFHFVSFAATSNAIVLTGYLMAERFAYFPSLGFSLALVSLATSLWPERMFCRLTPILAAVVLLLFVRTLIRNQDFSSDIRLWEATVREYPGNTRAWNMLANAYWRAGRTGEVEDAFRKGIEADPGFVDSYLFFASYLRSRGQVMEAAVLLDWLLEKNSGRIPLAQLQLAEALVELGYAAEALDILQRQMPAHSSAIQGYWFTRGKALERLGRMREAVADYRKALEGGGYPADLPDHLKNLLGRIDGTPPPTGPPPD